MSRGERKAMIRRGHPGLSLGRRCRLLSINRSSFYDAPTGESPSSLAPPFLLTAIPIEQADAGALMASGQITMRRVDGWQTLDQARWWSARTSIAAADSAGR